MENLNFDTELKLLLKELYALSNDIDGSASYEYLIKKLSELSLNNFESQKQMILHFITDSYDGGIEVENRVIQFLQRHSTKR
jgi:hypothetical protein